MIEDVSGHYLSESEGGVLLRIARDSLELWTRGGGRLDLGVYALTERLEEKHGAFVTLRQGGELRGCIGITSNVYPLAEAVLESTIGSASRDPRFEPVEARELEGITIEVSALGCGDTAESPFKRVGDVGEILIGRDGLYIRRPPQRGGLLLPQVAVDQGWGVEEFLAATCRKAGYGEDSWKEESVELYRFSAQVFEEDSSG